MEVPRLEHSELARRRIESKYLVPPERLYELAVRLPPAEVEAYPLTTVYLDRRDGGLSRRALESPMDCVKIRVRRYRPDEPYAWVEVKTRSRAWIEKRRFAVAAHRWPLIASRPPDPSLVLRPCSCLPCVAESKMAFHQFEKVAHGGLTAVGVVRGRRQRFRFGDLPLRLTLDLELRYYPPSAALFTTEAGVEPAESPAFVQPQAVLEVKRSDVPPEWMQDVLEGFSVCDYSKFRTLLAVVGFPARTWAKGLSA